MAECTEEEKTRTFTDEDGTVRIYLLNLNLDLIFTAKESVRGLVSVPFSPLIGRDRLGMLVELLVQENLERPSQQVALAERTGTNLRDFKIKL